MEKPESPQPAQCLICTEFKFPEGFVEMHHCLHKFCTDCLKSYLVSKIQSNQVYPLNCPFYRCSTDIACLSTRVLSESQAAQLNKFRLRSELQKNPNLRWCPVKDCSGYSYYEQLVNITCNTCSFEFCAKCGGAQHPGNCKRDPSIQNYIAKYRLRECPKCKNYIEKSFGCPSVVCAVCGINLCMKCGNLMNASHDILKCLVGGDYSQMPVYLMVFMCFSWVLFPFELGFLVIYLLEDWGSAEVKDPIYRHVMSYKWVYYCLFLMLSPLMSWVALALISVLSGVSIVDKLFKKFSLHRKTKSFSLVLKLLLNLAVMPLNASMIFGVFFLCNLVLPFVGVVFIGKRAYCKLIKYV